MSPSAATERFTNRSYFVLSLPLLAAVEVLRVEQVVIVIDRFHIDFGAFCFTKRSGEPRRPGRPRGVVLGSLIADRRPQIQTAIELLSSMMSDGAMRPRTVEERAKFFKAFMDWADLNNHHACLSGGDATLAAFRGWAHHVHERLRRFEISPRTARLLQQLVCQFLELITGVAGLHRGVRLVSGVGQSFGTEPAPEYEFGKVVALSQALFDGLSELVLANKPFPFRLVLPSSLGWEENHLWCFPANQWCLAPQLQSDPADRRPSRYFGAYNYQQGRVSTVSEIVTRYRRAIPSSAERGLRQGQAVLDAANSNSRHKIRLQLAVLAQAAFFFLFLANTGCNLAVSREIETDGLVSPSVEKQSYRSIKFRAGGKEITVVIPIAFLPSLRRFMELRKFLLQDTPYPFLFFSVGNSRQRVPSGRINEAVLVKYFSELRRISPTIPVIMSREIRATVEDYYRRRHDGFVSSSILGRSEASTDRSYLAGSPLHHHSEVSDFLVAVSQRAREQKIVKTSAQLADANRLEEGGRCSLPDNPIPLAGGPAMADCRSGCIFCANRILVANEEDTRKIASAAFVMEQLIAGPQSEAQFRPQIQKCDEDLERISSFDGCAPMVKRVRLDVFENGNLTPYFADKYLMFLELGVLQ
ncbi:hypothetical protein [Pseudoduganella lutea]|uniref:Uncharacterized protein n=1 Tax=Pseudoduganella lutea TaxID=321985 RepID=A0A4P6L1Y6_9BURK|nr:hypothetical protein [Pseudoduganella lutea]QBE64902.1 hypothetical protein EWM63_19450 [Pseudoduganella lutea]